jgi:hypothetical protein
MGYQEAAKAKRTRLPLVQNYPGSEGAGLPSLGIITLPIASVADERSISQKTGTAILVVSSPQDSPSSFLLRTRSLWPSLEDQLAVAISAAHEAQQAHQRAALASVEGHVTQKDLDKAAEALHKTNHRASTLRAAIVAAEEREKRQAEEAATAKRDAERAAIADKLLALRQVAVEWDNVVDALVEVAQRFDAAGRELYGKSPHSQIVQATERARVAAMEALAIRLQEFSRRPKLISPGFSVRLVDHMVEPEAARAANHK